MAFLTRYQIDPRKWTDCKLYYFLYYFGRHYSSMLLVLMSLEKCFAVYFPLKAKTVCTVGTAKWATGAAGIVLASCDLVYSVGIESFIKSSGRHLCVFKDGYFVILRATDSVLYSFGPFTIMLITNFAIVFKFMRAKCNEFSRVHQPSSSKICHQGDSYGGHCFRYFFTSDNTNGCRHDTFIWNSTIKQPILPSIYEFNSVFEPQHQWDIIHNRWIQIQKGAYQII